MNDVGRGDAYRRKLHALAEELESLPSDWELAIEDGDVLRWRVVDGELVVTVVRRREGAFDDFEPGVPRRRWTWLREHDDFGVA